MVKKIGQWAAVTVISRAFLYSCGIIQLSEHTHEWREADCTTPRMRAECGATEGTTGGRRPSKSR